MAKLTIQTPPTGTTPSPVYSDNVWLKYIWAALTNGGISPSGSGSGGGSSVGGGATTYSNLSGDFTATANNGTKTITLSAFANTVLSSVLSTNHFGSAVIKRVKTTGAVDTLPTTTVAYNTGTGVLTLADMAATFGVGDVVGVILFGPDKSFDETNDQQKVTQNTLIAGEDLTNNRLNTRRPLSYTNLSASALIKTGAGVVAGFIVNSHSSGTLKLWDNTAGSGSVLLNTITFAAGSGIVVPLPGDISFSTGLYATIGGTADITIFWG